MNMLKRITTAAFFILLVSSAFNSQLKSNENLLSEILHKILDDGIEPDETDHHGSLDILQGLRISEFDKEEELRNLNDLHDYTTKPNGILPLRNVTTEIDISGIPNPISVCLLGGKVDKIIFNKGASLTLQNNSPYIKLHSLIDIKEISFTYDTYSILCLPVVVGKAHGSFKDSNISIDITVNKKTSTVALVEIKVHKLGTGKLHFENLGSLAAMASELENKILPSVEKAITKTFEDHP